MADSGNRQTMKGFVSVTKDADSERCDYECCLDRRDTSKLEVNDFRRVVVS